MAWVEAGDIRAGLVVVDVLVRSRPAMVMPGWWWVR